MNREAIENIKCILNVPTYFNLDGVIGIKMQTRFKEYSFSLTNLHVKGNDIAEVVTGNLGFEKESFIHTFGDNPLATCWQSAWVFMNDKDTRFTLMYKDENEFVDGSLIIGNHVRELHS